MNPDNRLDLIKPEWPAPAHIRAFTTTRTGGVSKGVYQSFNLAMHVEDDADAVRTNREYLMQYAGLPQQPLWLQQVHSKRLVCAHDANHTEADGAWTDRSNIVCAVMTADCLPVLFCNMDGSKIAVAHAGWRGMHAGIITEAVSVLDIAADDCLVWLGPAIGPGAFEVGEDVLQQFITRDKNNAQAFTRKDDNHWWCDLYQLARMELTGHGITKIYGGDLCTFSDAERFYSYRRDGQTGRMASVIWIQK